MESFVITPRPHSIKHQIDQMRDAKKGCQAKKEDRLPLPEFSAQGYGEGYARLYNTAPKKVKNFAWESTWDDTKSKVRLQL